MPVSWDKPSKPANFHLTHKLLSITCNADTYQCDNESYECVQDMQLAGVCIDRIYKLSVYTADKQYVGQYMSAYTQEHTHELRNHGYIRYSHNDGPTTYLQIILLL